MRVALVGLGAMGSRHLRALQYCDKIQKIVTIDPDPAAKADYLTVSMALTDSSYDFAVVASPTISHEDCASRFLRSGIPVLLEKPVADNVAAAQRIATIAKETSTKVAIGHIERFNPAIRALMADLTENPLSVVLKRVSEYPDRIRDVGVALDLSIHDIDLARYITGANITKINSVLQSNKNSCEDIAMYLLRLDNGGAVSIQTSWMSPRQQRWAEVTTTSAVYEVDMLAQKTSKYTNVDDCGYGVTSLYVKREDQLTSQLDAFINYLLTVEQKELCLLADGIEALKIVEDSLNESMH